MRCSVSTAYSQILFSARARRLNHLIEAAYFKARSVSGNVRFASIVFYLLPIPCLANNDIGERHDVLGIII